MATLISAATGNWTSSSTWKVASAALAAEFDSDLSAFNVSSSIAPSNSFTLPATAVDAVALKIKSITVPSGTLTVSLFDITTSTAVRTVTINASDLQAKATGWHIFKFSSSITPTAGHQYRINVNRSIADSSSDRISLSSQSSVSTNMSVLVRTTTTGTPSNGDKIVIAGEYTGAGTSNSYTVTMDYTGSNVFGVGFVFGSFQDREAISINPKGTLTYANSSSTNYKLTVSRNVTVFSGGTLQIGTGVSPIPANSTAQLLFQPGNSLECALIVKYGGTLVTQGQSKSFGWTYMSADKSAGATVISVLDTTNWRAGDKLCFAPTERTYSEFESKTISSVDSSTQVTLTSGLTYAHSGTSPTRAEVGNLTRNVLFSSNQTGTDRTYVLLEDGSNSTIHFAEFNNLGDPDNGHAVIEHVQQTAGSCDIDGCAIHDCTVDDSITACLASASTGFSLNASVIYNITSVGFSYQYTGSSDTPSNSFTNSLIVGIVNSLAFQGTGASFGGGAIVFTGTNVAGCYSDGIAIFNANNSRVTSFDTIVSHSNGANGFFAQLLTVGGTISNLTCWRNGGGASSGSGLTLKGWNWTIDTATFFGNRASNIILDAMSSTIINATAAGDSTYSTTNGLFVGTDFPVYDCVLENCTFGVASGIQVAHTNDVHWGETSLDGVQGRVIMRNCKFASSTELLNQNLMVSESILTSQKHNQIAGNHKTWKLYGTLSSDSTIYANSSPSLRMTPTSSLNKFTSIGWRGGFYLRVLAGETPTVSVKVRQSVIGDGTAYNGNFARLRYRAFHTIDTTTDTTLATATSASNGSFETLSGTISAQVNDCIIEVYVDCDGTAGWVNIDDFGIS
jgi:hypothetical protein